MNRLLKGSAAALSLCGAALLAVPCSAEPVVSDPDVYIVTEIISDPAAVTARSDAARAMLPESVEADTLTVIPAADVVVSFPVLLTERGRVASIDPVKKSFELRRKDGTLTTVSVDEGTLMEHVYADIFASDSESGFDKMKIGDKVRARVFPPKNGRENALIVDIFHL